MVWGRTKSIFQGGKMKNFLLFTGILLFSVLANSTTVVQPDPNLHWMKIRATNKFERSKIANTGASIESVKEDYVIVYATPEEKQSLEKMGNVLVSFPLTQQMMDEFPANDEMFHDYAELEAAMKDLSAKYPFVKLSVIGKSVEGRNLYVMTITNHAAQRETDVPATFFLGTHHAREHISTETPFLLAKFIAEEYTNNNKRVVQLVNNRVIYIMPLVNPDGAEFDISGGNYHMWRKNRAKSNGNVFGVDLNRNYGWGFGGEGSSPNKNSETYHGPSAFSEPEALAVKNFIDTHSNITMLLSFHTFSQLVLYPWGNTNDPISKTQDLQVFQKMANTMAGWNGYTPEQSSELYVASGDTTDWAYGEHGIFAFTFELDPGSMWEGGFYPGQSFIEPVFKKNLEPCLYMIEYSDNPYRVIQNTAPGLSYLKF